MIHFFHIYILVPFIFCTAVVLRSGLIHQAQFCSLLVEGLRLFFVQQAMACFEALVMLKIVFIVLIDEGHCCRNVRLLKFGHF